MTRTRLLDLGTDPGDDPDLRIRKRTAVAVALVFMAVAVVLGVADLLLGEWEYVLLAAIQVLAFGSALVLFSRTHHLAPLVATMVVGGLIILFASIIPDGGLITGAADLVWIVLVPIAAVLLLGSRAALPALVAVVLVVIASAVISPFLRPAPQDPTPARLLFAAVDLIVPTAIALALVLFIDGERVRAKAESDALLLNVLPRQIADRLKGGELVIADDCEEVTVLFADVVEFTPFAARESAARVVEVLNELFSRFDALAERHGLEKIKTIGDAYMVVAGVPEPRHDHASVIVDMAIAMLAEAAATETAPGTPLRLRIGIASGPAVAGVIGTRKFSYDLWGDTVNVASRLESSGAPGAIQVSASTWQQCGDRYPFTPRDVDIKGLGPMRTYVLNPAGVS